MKEVVIYFVICLLAIAALASLLTLVAYDNSDAPPVRSGMVPLTDHLTGCQYLRTFSGITPRLRADGTQICK